MLLWRGLKIALQAPDSLGSVMAAGLTFWIMVEAFMNMGVMVGLLPSAGNALPFISAGGSNLISIAGRHRHLGQYLPPIRANNAGIRSEARNGERIVRLLICAGGTGGGVNPALAVLNALRKEYTDMQTAVGGRRGGMEAGLVERRAFPSKAFPPQGCMAWA